MLQLISTGFVNNGKNTDRHISNEPRSLHLSTLILLQCTITTTLNLQQNSNKPKHTLKTNIANSLMTIAQS